MLPGRELQIRAQPQTGHGSSSEVSVTSPIALSSPLTTQPSSSWPETMRMTAGVSATLPRCMDTGGRALKARMLAHHAFDWQLLDVP